MPNFWALKNLKKGQQFACWTLIAEQAAGICGHYQESWDCCCSHLNQATQKNTCQILLPLKNPGNENFLGRAFWSENGYRLCLSGIPGFRGNYGSVWTYLSFQFQIACENISFSSVFAGRDVLRETSLAATSEEKRMFSQAKFQMTKK